MDAWMDAHCHATPRFAPHPWEQWIQELKAKACEGLVIGGVDPEDWQEQLSLAWPGIRFFRSFGLHPWHVLSHSSEQLEKDFEILSSLLSKADALGEIGLDYHRAKSKDDRSHQILFFAKQLPLAIQLRKPLILHIVAAHDEALSLLNKARHSFSGIVHSYWANRTITRRWLDLGLYLSLHPRITQEDPHQLLSFIPRQRLLFETDSPYQQSAGNWHHPSDIVAIIKRLCLRQSWDWQEVLAEQSQKILALFSTAKPS